MGIKVMKLFLFILFSLIFFPSPAYACEPFFSVGYIAVFIAYIVWLIIGGSLYNKTSFVRKGFIFWAIVVPIGLLSTVVPTLIILLFLPFPFYLAIQYFIAVFDKNISERRYRLKYYGIPTLIIIVLGILFKFLLYASDGGLRRFMWNYFEEGKFVFIILLILGIVILIAAMIQRVIDKKKATKAQA
ncbi:MAG: hypothetical protein M1269_10705 [Chloroflexi bacterium]|nr:hypothetical protein [Chloroflexota bacterium]